MAKRKKKEKTELTKPVETPPPEVAVLDPNTVLQTESASLISNATLPPVAETTRPHAIDFNVPRSVAHDNQAGIRLLKFEKFKQFQLQLPADAPAEIFQELRDKGWTYRTEEKVYTKQYGDQGPGALYVEARRLYQDLCKQLSPAGQTIPY